MVRTEPLDWPPVPDRVWDEIRAEFGLFTVDQFEMHFETLFDDPEPFLQQAVRVFVGDETFFPGFQMHDFQLHNTGLHPVVLALYNQALEQEIPHNVFSAWMMPPLIKGQSGRLMHLTNLQYSQYLRGHWTILPTADPGYLPGHPFLSLTDVRPRSPHKDRAAAGPELTQETKRDDEPAVRFVGATVCF